MIQHLVEMPHKVLPCGLHTGHSTGSGYLFLRLPVYDQLESHIIRISYSYEHYYITMHTEPPVLYLWRVPLSKANVLGCYWRNRQSTSVGLGFY
jgi:hypothetical protein